MRQRANTRHRPEGSTNADMLAVLDDVEPELRQLEGILMVLTLLGEAQDSVEPITLASLGRAARETFERIGTSWRTVSAGLR